VVATQSALLFSVLGPLRVEHPGSEIRVGGARRRGVLLRLLASANHVVATDLLAEDVWDGSPPAAAASTLQSHVSDLRQLVGSDRLAFADGGYQIRIEEGELDAWLFEADLAAGRAAIAEGSLSAGLDTLERGLGRWRGSAFADASGLGWTLIFSRRLEEERGAAIEDALDARLAIGLHNEVCVLAEEAVASEPFRERRWEALMLALYRAGRQADALRAYQRARAILGEQLGIEPSPGLVRMEHDILVHSPTLAWDGPILAAAAHVEMPGGEAARTNLPVPMSGFVGRHRELAELDKLVGAHRLVSIVGTGGIGKTRLAIEVAGGRMSQLRDGAWFVDLTSVPDAGGLPGAVAAALGLLSAGEEPLEKLLMERAKDMQALVVLDNCEHIVAAAAALIERMLESGPALRVLTTSREPLRIPGEKLWPAPPIATPEHPADLDAEDLADFDAVRLFVERAGDSAGLEDPGPAELRLIADITARLDGLPLAIELAAARTGSLDLAELAALDDRLGVLGRGSRTARSRHQTLAATIDWSYQLLPADLRSAIRRLSVFVGGFTVEAAAAVTAADDAGDADPSSSTAETVAGLAERSLLNFARPAPQSPQRNRKARYAMLETVRQFAAERLVEDNGRDGEARAKQAHCRYYAELAATTSGALVGWQQGRWLDALELEHANIEAAITHLIERPGGAPEALAMIVHLDRFWHNRGHLAECSNLLRRSLDLAGDSISTSLHCGVLRLAGQVAARLRDVEFARKCYTECLRMARETGDDYNAASAMTGLCSVAYYAGAPAAGLVVGREGVELARKVGDLVLLGECLVHYGISLMDDLSLSESVYEEAISVTRLSGDRVYLALAYNNLGTALSNQDLGLPAVTEYYEQARDIFTEIGIPDVISPINLGWTYLYQGEREAADDIFTVALLGCRRCQLRCEGAYAVLGLACTATAASEWERAAALLGFADAELDDCRQSLQEPERTYRQDALAKVRHQLGHRAEDLYDRGRVRDRGQMMEMALRRSSA
jgi:predicted ATPase/DNA-binding SARP family transcriptional activator